MSDNQEQLLISNMTKKLSMILTLIDEVNSDAKSLDSNVVPGGSFSCTDHEDCSVYSVYALKMVFAEYAVKKEYFAMNLKKK